MACIYSMKQMENTYSFFCKKIQKNYHYSNHLKMPEI